MFTTSCLRRAFLQRLSVILVAAFGGLCTFSACSGASDEFPSDSKSRVCVDVSGFYFKVGDMGIPTRSDGDVVSAATRLSFAVFSADGELVEDVIHQLSSNDGFGTVEMELYPGTYQLVAVAHSGTTDAVITSPSSVTLPGITYTDTFAKVQSLTVESNTDCDLSMTLSRLTSAFILQLADTPPAHVKEIEVVVNALGAEPTALEINPNTGVATKHLKQTCTIPVADLSEEVPVYFIGAAKSSKVTVIANDYDEEGNEVISHTLNTVPLEANRKTIATGTFFQSQGAGTFTIDTAWGDDWEVDY